MSCGNCVDCSNKCMDHCSVCIECDSFTTSCDTQQTFCSGDQEKGQLASAYIGAANMPSFKRDDIIIETFPRKTLNDMISYVSKAAALGGEGERGQDSGGWTADPETRNFIYADKINELLDGIASLSGQSAGAKVQKDDIIYADFFSGISSTINELTLSSGACRVCVTQCDTSCNTCDECDKCETCDECLSCDSCQSVTSYSSHYSSHYSSTPASCEETAV